MRTQFFNPNERKKQAYLSQKISLFTAGDRNRTGTIVTNRRILSPVRLPVPPPRPPQANDGIRTRDPHLGKVVFYH